MTYFVFFMSEDIKPKLNIKKQSINLQIQHKTFRMGKDFWFYWGIILDLTLRPLNLHCKNKSLSASGWDLEQEAIFLVNTTHSECDL